MTSASKHIGALLATAAISALVSACGGSTQKTGTTGISPQDAAVTQASKEANPATYKYPQAPIETKKDADEDQDIGAPQDDVNPEQALGLTRTANAKDTRAITTLIKRYYAVAVAENGVAGCAMLFPTIAESVPEDFGLSPPGPPYARGTTCAGVLTLTFRHFHPQLALEVPHLTVARVLIRGRNAQAILHFGKLPERVIMVEREGPRWRIGALLDSQMP